MCANFFKLNEKQYSFYKQQMVEYNKYHYIAQSCEKEIGSSLRGNQLAIINSVTSTQRHTCIQIPETYACYIRLIIHTDVQQ